MQKSLTGIHKQFIQLVFICTSLLASSYAFADTTLESLVDAQTSKHPHLSGAYVLEKGENALFARAWIGDHAQKSIDVQYFIWSTDNIGILAAESLLRAAERGVKIRVIVDDLLIDAEDKTMVALALHPNISIRIYNPNSSVGTSIIKRTLNVITDFRGVNQRMHNKTFIADNLVAITGGRNMADEYYDYNNEYNFRDRDVLVAGPVVNNMKQVFESYWNNYLSVDVKELLQSTKQWMTQDEVRAVYHELHNYANDPANFEPEIRNNILHLIDNHFSELVTGMAWTNVHYVSDKPGKNETTSGLSGSGNTTHLLANLLRDARHSVTIQSPYVVFSDEAKQLFTSLIKNGVSIKISTNSLAASDNLPAFSGYNKQRTQLLEMGVQLFEFKPHPVLEKAIMQRYRRVRQHNPIFAIHAKTLIIDRETVFIGTYNLDPRSQNLNTESGIYLYNATLAGRVEDNILNDMAKGNSWDASKENGNSRVGLIKRSSNFLLQFFPLTPIL